MREQKLGRGMSIAGFDSADEVFAYMADQERQAIERALPQQWDIGWGTRVFRLVDDLAIWGHIYTEREFLAANSKPGEGPDEEIMEELDSLRDAHNRGYRYGLWFSEVEPTGEYGSAHVATLWEISYEDFQTARKNGWLLWRELAVQIKQEMEQAQPNHEGDEG